MAARRFSVFCHWLVMSTALLGAPDSPAPQREVSENTRKMWEILNQRMDTVDCEELKFLKNDLIAERLRGRLNENPSSLQPTLRLRFASELLLGGKTEEAIEQFDMLLEADGVNGAPNPQALRLKQMLAIGWLRLGEERNCLLKHTSDSCIVPIQEGGVYTDREATLKARDLLVEVLRSSPDEYILRWLLNVAAMTLGDYPGAVPDEFRISLPQPKSPTEFPAFTDIAAGLGLALFEYAGGSSLEDFDNDGDIDLFVDSEGFSHPCRYFTNNGDGSFTDRTNESGLWGEIGGRVTATADYNNDGFVDIFVCRGAWMTTEKHHLPNTLLRNNGNGTFDNVTLEAGVLAFHPTSHAAWGDFDNDGWVDLFVCNESKKPDQHPHPCELYHNNRDGTFTNVAQSLGVDAVGMMKAASWGDYDKDGFLDLFVSNLEGPNRLFKNVPAGNTGGRRFQDVARQSGTSEPAECFPAFFFDFDNDGWLDIYVSAFPAPHKGVSEVIKGYLGLPVSPEATSRLYRNNKDGTFTDIAATAGLDFAVYAMSASHGDLDNDGYQDIYSGTGHLEPQYIIPNVMLRNVAGRRFDDVTVPSRLGNIQKGHGISFADIDNDGDLDIFSVMGGGFTTDRFFRSLYLNPGTKNAWVNLKLVGTKSNRAALHSRVEIKVQTSGGPMTVPITIANQGTFASSPMEKLIGLGAATAIESVEVFWQGANVSQSIKGIELGHAYTLTEGETEPKQRTYRPIDLSKAATHGHEHHKHH
ncbi:MAG: FG-GAP-like repeat-containing protein [Verrucomicrobiales bacterium]